MATDEKRKDCWDQAFYAFGTGYIFEQRSNRSRKKLRRLSFLGIAVPVVVGGIFVAFFGIDQMKPFLGGLIIIAAVLSTVQVVFTVWSFIAKWEDQAIYGSEASVENYQIARLYEELAKYDPVDFDSKYDLLNVRNQMRSIEDGKKEITEPEKRMGMRVALRKFQRACVKCAQIPVDLNPTDCPVCGNCGNYK